jgi:hypothetical protein
VIEITDHNLADCSVCKSSPIVVEIYDYLAVCRCRDPVWGWSMDRLEKHWKDRKSYIKKHKIKKFSGGPG